jgi:hypothetical protein
MSIITDIQAVAAALQLALNEIEKLDPNAANNAVVQEIQKALNLLKAI